MNKLQVLQKCLTPVQLSNFIADYSNSLLTTDGHSDGWNWLLEDECEPNNIIRTAFIWKHSSKGHRYWEKISINLYNQSK